MPKDRRKFILAFDLRHLTSTDIPLIPKSIKLAPSFHQLAPDLISTSDQPDIVLAIPGNAGLDYRSAHEMWPACIPLSFPEQTVYVTTGCVNGVTIPYSLGNFV